MFGKRNRLLTLAAFVALVAASSRIAVAQSGLEGRPPTGMRRLPPRPAAMHRPRPVIPAAAQESLSPSEMETRRDLLKQDEISHSPPLPTPSFAHFDGASCGPLQGCPPVLPQMYVNVEALLWWTSGDRVVPLATTSPLGTSIDEAGALGNPDTRILFGNEGLSDSVRGGVRFTVGTWLGECTRLEASYFGLAETHDDFLRDSGETPILSRPFLNINDAIDDHQRVTFAGDEGEIGGSLGIDHASLFQGAAVLTKHSLVQINGGCISAQLAAISGYRHLSLDESLRVRATSVIVDDPLQVLIPGTRLNVRDDFITENSFHGSVVGLATEFSGPCWSLDMFAQVAIGRSHEEIVIRGRSTSSVPGGGDAESISGGLLAQPSNIGRYRRNELAFVPEFGAKLHYRFRPCWQFNVGYDFLYWSQVARPGEQVDFAINTTQLGGGDLDGSAHPDFNFRNACFWAHGLSLGLECEF